MDRAHYFQVLYPFQDRVLKVLNGIETNFYLSGGTAASRGYLNHRFSDDLDLFVDDDDRFGLWTARVIQALSQSGGWQTEILLREARFARLVLIEAETTLKIELINDVPARVGTVQQHPVLGRLDNAENILANKITALLDREEPKDLADIWGFCCWMKLSLGEALTGAQGKAAGVFPLDLARVLLSATGADWEQIRWIDARPVEQFLADLHRLGESLILAR
ncbi:MAG: hypothetical protein GQ526_11050 [Ardenticatenales bacterium]|nr:hypothetical protein [Ardenticatenales bacterium]